MTGKTHQLIGFTTALAVSTATIKIGGTETIPFCIGMVAGSCLGSYIPDMDHTGSKLGRKLAIISHPIHLLSQMCLSIHRKTGGKISKWFGELLAHRGIFHAPLFWGIIMAILIKTVPPLFATAFASMLTRAILTGVGLGIGAHLIADMLNPTGIPLFAPFSLKKMRIARILTGSRAEWFVIGACLLVVVLNTALLFI